MTREEAKAQCDELSAQHASQTATAAPGIAGIPAHIDWGKLITIVKFILDNLPVAHTPAPVAKAEAVKEEPEKKGGLGGFGKK